MAEAERVIQAYEFTKPDAEGGQGKAEHQKNWWQEQPTQKRNEKKEEKKRNDVWTVDDEPSKKKKKVRSYDPKYEFKTDCYSILMEIKDRLKFDKPQPMKGPVKFRDRSKYCHFHKDVGHNTNDCINLKKLLDKLAAEGHLDSYVLKSIVTL